MAENQRTLTYRIDVEKHRKLKLAAVQSGRTLKDLLDDSVDRVLKEHEKEIQAAQGEKR